MGWERFLSSGARAGPDRSVGCGRRRPGQRGGVRRPTRHGELAGRVVPVQLRVLCHSTGSARSRRGGSRRALGSGYRSEGSPAGDPSPGSNNSAWPVPRAEPRGSTRATPLKGAGRSPLQRGFSRCSHGVQPVAAAGDPSSGKPYGSDGKGQTEWPGESASLTVFRFGGEKAFQGAVHPRRARVAPIRVQARPGNDCPVARTRPELENGPQSRPAALRHAAVGRGGATDRLAVTIRRRPALSG
jgi:hypothetical protein